MNILFLTQVLPFPLDAGPKVRAYFTLRHLTARHAVTLVSLLRPTDDPQAVAHLESLCTRVVTVPFSRSPVRDMLALGHSLIGGEPFLIARDRIARLRQTVAALIARSHYDVVHADQLWMAPYALAARADAECAGYVPRLVLDQHNAVHLVPRRMSEATDNPVMRWLLNTEARRLARFEAGICRQFDRVVVVSTEDGRALRELYPNDGRSMPISMIPICVEPGLPPREQCAAEPGILFLGGMHWPPNRDAALWFVRAVLPRVWEGMPSARFYAVGRQPPLELQTVNGSDLHSRVTAPGYVIDPEAYWERSRLFVVPLRSGGGMRVKILDAWMRGLPVVSTTLGAEGLSCHPGEDILIADTPEAMAEAVVRVLSDDELAARLARAGRATLERHYDWRKVYPAWDEIYASLEIERPILRQGR